LGEIRQFSIIQDGGRRHIGFLKFQILTVGLVKRTDCIIVLNFVEIAQNRDQGMEIFQFFQDGGRPPSWICDVCAIWWSLALCKIWL